MGQLPNCLANAVDLLSSQLDIPRAAGEGFCFTSIDFFFLTFNRLASPECFPEQTQNRRL